ncbi:MAG: hypothetical protein KDD44_07725, partial [Bdellovibrionales bacterium]|nr:hypothetical protein [Bdellovibrionales bacterium]
MAYSAAARSAAGGTGAMQAIIANAVEDANLAYANSSVDLNMRLVGTVETSYAETGDFDVDLPRLAGVSDGYMDEIHGLRNSY